MLQQNLVPEDYPGFVYPGKLGSNLTARGSVVHQSSRHYQKLGCSEAQIIPIWVVLSVPVLSTVHTPDVKVDFLRFQWLVLGEYTLHLEVVSQALFSNVNLIVPKLVRYVVNALVTLRGETHK